MRRASLFGGSLLVAAYLAGTGAALTQEVQFDSKALDATGASAAPAKRKGKKAAAETGQTQQQPAQGGKPGANRQFGELEGWSPGKEPPKPKDKYDADPNSTSSSSSSGKPGVSVTPSGSMNVGLPF